MEFTILDLPLEVQALIIAFTGYKDPLLRLLRMVCPLWREFIKVKSSKGSQIRLIFFETIHKNYLHLYVCLYKYTKGLPRSFVMYCDKETNPRRLEIMYNIISRNITNARNYHLLYLAKALYYKTICTCTVSFLVDTFLDRCEGPICINYLNIVFDIALGLGRLHWLKDMDKVGIRFTKYHIRRAMKHGNTKIVKFLKNKSRNSK